MLKRLVPRIAIPDLLPMFGVAFLGAIIAGGYGVLHDQVTYSISPEYFTNFKFKQFHYADFALGDRVFVSCIGFLATWWVGFIIAWFLARRLIPDQPRAIAYRKVLQGFVVVFACGILAGTAGYLYGTWRGPDADYSVWQPVINQFKITDTAAFVRVAYIHNASYLGGLIGFFVSLIVVRPEKLASHDG